MKRPAPGLSGKQRRHLRSLGHHLRPVVMVGKAGLTDGVRRQLDAALEDHELVKVRIERAFEDDLDRAFDSLAGTAGAAVAGRLGRTALLYRAREEQPTIRLPGAAGGEGDGR